MTARPFLKWAGGKTRLLDEILKRVPDEIREYHEPFIGGGALFFRLVSEGRIKGASFLSDSNEELIATYRAVRSDVESLIGQLEVMPNEKDHFLDVRSRHYEDDVDCASRFIYLNKTAFNGLYRVNKQGRFNVPFGGYGTPRICDESNLRACSAALCNVDLTWGDFEMSLGLAEKGAFVYLDPPYPPSSKTASFTAYTKDAFGWNEHIRLRDAILRLRDRGVWFVLSNADQPRVEELYSGQGFGIHRVSTTRSVSAKASSRGKMTELLIAG